MSDEVPVKTPAGFAPVFAIGQSDSNAKLRIVGPHAPLSVTRAAVDAPTPLTGNAGSTQLVGPFRPAPFVPIVLSLSGAWEGAVTVMRSVDDGTTRHPLTVGGTPWGRYTSNICEPFWEEAEAAASFWLDLAPTSGTISYRLSQ